MTHHIAQLNIAKMIAPLDDPVMHDFVAALDRINALADNSPGFVWRLKDEDGDATAIKAYADETILVNLSVWETVAALKDFVYKSGHREIMRRRGSWFEPHTDPYLVLWWIARGSVPSIEEAKQRLEWLKTNGPTERAFSISKAFPPPGGVDN